MATKKYGVKSPEWWKHLRKYCKRRFWKAHRKSFSKDNRNGKHD